jgi:hypothetical protein
MLVPLLLSLSAPAYAACEKDTDCKGDRVCTNGECAEPAAPGVPAAVPVGPKAVSAEARAKAEDYVGSARGKEIVGWALGGSGVAVSVLGLAAGGWDFDNLSGPTELFISMAGFGMMSAALPITAGGGSRGRDGLRLLGQPRPGSGLRAAGWSTYGGMMFFGFLGLMSGIADVSGDYFLFGYNPELWAGLSILSGTTSLAMFEVDSMVARGRLTRSLAVADGEIFPGENRRVAFTLAPIAGATRDGAMVGVGGSF